MKTCPNCSAQAHDSTEFCECGADLRGRVVTPAADLPPDGSTPIAVGWVCLGLSVISGGISWLSYQIAMEDQDMVRASAYYADKVSDSLAISASATTASWMLFAMFLVFWSTGYIVQAISRKG